MTVEQHKREKVYREKERERETRKAPHRAGRRSREAQRKKMKREGERERLLKGMLESERSCGGGVSTLRL